MIEWSRISTHRSVWITGMVVLAHAVILSWVASLRVGMTVSPVLEILEIDFAEVLPLPEPRLEPETHSRAEPEKQDAPKPRSKPDSSASPAAAPSPMTILTQLESETNASTPPSARVPSVDTAQTVDPNALAAVLQRVDCQRLSFKVDEDCPKLDPFDVAEASMARQMAVPSSAQLVGDYGPKSMLEGVFSQRDKDPYLMPGMDGELFTSGMAPGAYDAQRIRNGRAPLWSKEMTDGFTKSDE